jgi:hypothetical protein
MSESNNILTEELNHRYKDPHKSFNNFNFNELTKKMLE